MSRSTTKPVKWLVRSKDRSAWASAQSDQSSLSTFGIWSLATHTAYIKDFDQFWSDLANVQADLSLCQAHKSFCWYVMLWLV